MRLLSTIYRIKQSYDQLTETEVRIADFILAQPNQIVESSSADLAHLTSTSPSAWNRFARKLGYSGIRDLKIALARSEQVKNDPANMLEANESVTSLIQKEGQLVEQSLQGTLSLLNQSDLDQAITWLDQAQRIYMVGVGGSSVVVTDFLHKLTRMGKQVIHNPDHHILLTQFAHINQDDVLLAVSYSGMTNTVTVAADQAKAKGAKIIAVTGFHLNSYLAKLADCSLYIPAKEGNIRLGAIQSRFASLIITDILYYGLVTRHLDETKASLLASREIVNNIK